MRYVALILFLVVSVYAMSQERAIVYGKITDEKGKALELVNVAISGLPGGTMTDRRGKYELEVPANIEVYVAMSFIGLEKEVERVFLQPGERFEVNKTLKTTYTELPQVEVEDKQLRSTSMVRIDPKAALNVPTSTDKISTLLITLPGVSSRNDLSSQYSVRGGNFDENLIYVNDIEIYRPFLIRSGQQEGLSFVNSDLVSSLLFSAGGFDAKYGDKMSSVLDLQYKKPTEFGGSAAVSLLGASAHVEGLITKKFSYLLGVRYKTTQYLLKGLDTEGDYKPRFLDVQTSLNYEISKKVEISFLGIYANNKYNFEPQSRETDYGTIQDPRRLTVYFEGQEIDHFENYLGGLTLTYKPNNQTRLKLIASGYNSVESESFDVIGQYWIGRVDTDFGSENFGDVTEVLGVGTQMNHARNQMDINVFNFGHKGTKEMKNQLLKWGVRYQHEQIDDHMNEWILIDSAGYSLPRPPDTPGIIDTLVNPFDLYELIKTNNTIGSNRYTAFIQNTFGVADSSRYSLTLGVRANYWDYNNQLVLSPRMTFSFKPKWKRDILFRISSGLYYQPPFYKELKDMNGQINENQEAQMSFHVVAASDWNFQAWGRPFKFITEVYYKYMDQLIPYTVDNVRIRYYAFQQSHGYATGIDLKVNGEFVKGVESWASISLMSTQEDVYGDVYYTDGEVDESRGEPGYIPRPTDQRFSASIFFQDYLPMNPTYKMSLTFIYSTGLPFGAPNTERYQQTLRMRSYRRVDIGFSKEIIGEHSRFSSKNPFRVFKSLWLTAEVLNLLGANNVVSYIWVTDFSGYQNPVPNYSMPRQFNVKLMATF